MKKAAVSLISLEPSEASVQPDAQGDSTGKPILKDAPASRGLLAALVYDSLGDLLSEVQDDFQPVQLHRASTAEEVALFVSSSDTALLFGEVAQPDDAFQLLLALRQLKTPISTGQVRVIVNCTLPSKTFIEKLRSYGVSEIVSGVDQPESAVQKARVIAELLLFRRSVARLPGGKLSSIGLAFMLSEWVTQHGIDYPNLAHLYCACLSSACGGARFEFLNRDSSGEWACIASNDGTASQWLNTVSEVDTSKSGEVRIEWIGDKRGALVCAASTDLSPEHERLLQAAADLAANFVLLDQPNMAFKRSGLKY